MKNKKRKRVFPPRMVDRTTGVFGYDEDGMTLDSDVVSSTEMTGAVPAARREPYDEDAFEAYYF